MAARYRNEPDLFRIQLSKGSSHLNRDDLVRVPMINFNFRNLIPRENRLQSDDIVKPML